MNNGFGVSPLEIQAADAQLKGLLYLEEFDYPARWLTGTQTALPANDSREVPIQIDGSSDFVIQAYQMTVFDSEGALEPNPNFLISFTKDGSGRRMSSGPVHVLNICGSYQENKYPSRLAYPVFLPLKSTYSILLENLSADAPDQVEFLMHGFKVYYTPPGGSGLDADQIRRQVFHVL